MCKIIILAGHSNGFSYAGVAQLVEQLIRNEKVGGSTPLSGTKLFINV